MTNSKVPSRALYVGETSRSLRERAVEHLDGGRNLDEKNFITKHWLQDHQEDTVPPEFTFKVDTIHKDPLSREIDEAIKIQVCKVEFNNLNSKSEWNGATLSRLCIEKSSWEKKKEALKESEKEAQEKAAVEKMKKKNKQVSFESAIIKNKLRNEGVPSPHFSKPNDLLPDQLARVNKDNSDEYNLFKNSSFSRSTKRKQRTPAEQRGEPERKKKPSPVAPRPCQTPFLHTETTQSQENQALLTGTAREVLLTRIDASRPTTLISTPCVSVTTDSSKDCTTKVKEKNRELGASNKHWRIMLSAGRSIPTIRNKKKISVNLSLGERKCKGDLAQPSFDSCLSSGLREFIGRIEEGGDVMDTLKQDVCGGFLWSLRDKLPEPENEVYDEGGAYCLDDPLDYLKTASEWCDDDEEIVENNEYERQLDPRHQDELIKRMMKLELMKKKTESEQEKSINSPLSESVWKFMMLLSAKLDENKVPNLFEEQGASPTTNLLVGMLRCHKLRTTYDFEKAVGRSFNLGEVQWDFRLLDKVAGKGTSTDAIFMLKEKGNFGGAKRKLKFPKWGMPPEKNVKVNEVCDLVESLSIKKNYKPSAQGKGALSPKLGLKVSKTVCGWSGSRKISPKKVSPSKMKVLSSTREPCSSARSPTTPVTRKIKPRGEKKYTLTTSKGGNRTPVSNRKSNNGTILKFLHKTPSKSGEEQASNGDES